MTIQRKSGYYWYRYTDESEWRIAEYDATYDDWLVWGSDMTFTNDEFINGEFGCGDIEVDETAIVRCEVKK